MRENAILTYTNTKFYPLDPRVEEVKLEDIAHALAQMCRANGHFKTFYSVAQHSLNCAREAKTRGWSDRVQLACLLHDASEAYISDITRPVKCYLDEYRKIEHRLQQVIFERFGIGDLTSDELKKVEIVDNALLYYEFEHLHHQGLLADPPKLSSCPVITEQSMPAVEAEFIQLAQHFMREIAAGGGSYKCVGIDSCKRTGKYHGWAVFWLLSDGSFGYGIYPNITAIVAEHRDADCLLIDIPIGLPENAQEELARPDRELRNRLPGKKSSVFNPPCRQAVYCDDKQAAKAINLKYLGKSLSEQSLGFSKKIREVDQFLLGNPNFIGRLREAHPEYSFAVLNDGRPLESSKSEEAGIAERQAVLSRYFGHTEHVLTEIQSRYPKLLMDDFVDAVVLAVIGRIGMQNGFETIPERPVKDSRGLPMEIVYAKLV